jgi:hypothetical protein
MGGLGGRRGKRIGVSHKIFVEKSVEKWKTMRKPCGYVENRFSSPRRMPYTIRVLSRRTPHMEGGEIVRTSVLGNCAKPWTSLNRNSQTA